MNNNNNNNNTKNIAIIMCTLYTFIYNYIHMYMQCFIIYYIQCTVQSCWLLYEASEMTARLVLTEPCRLSEKCLTKRRSLIMRPPKRIPTKILP